MIQRNSRRKKDLKKICAQFFEMQKKEEHYEMNK